MASFCSLYRPQLSPKEIRKGHHLLCGKQPVSGPIVWDVEDWLNRSSACPLSGTFVQ